MTPQTTPEAELRALIREARAITFDDLEMGETDILGLLERLADALQATAEPRGGEETGTQPFEAHPRLAGWLERLANTSIGHGFSLASWGAFLGEINALARRCAVAEAALVELRDDEHMPCGIRNFCMSALDRALASSPPLLESGRGGEWHLVPVEPTEQMLFKGNRATAEDYGGSTRYAPLNVTRDVWAAMLSAAPPREEGP